MVDAKGKTVGLLYSPFFVSPYPGVPPAAFVVRQISKIWVVLEVADFITGFLITESPGRVGVPQYFYQSADCTGQAYLRVNSSVVGGMVATGPAIGYVATIPPATAPSIYFAGLAATLTMNSVLGYGSPCFPWAAGNNPLYVGPVETIPVSALGLTLPFSIK
jgi:hypothetical protein